MDPCTLTNLHACDVCGALVAGGPDFMESAATHAAWHGLLERRIDEAERTYTPPPRYG